MCTLCFFVRRTNNSSDIPYLLSLLHVPRAEAKRALQSGCGGADLITLEFKPNCYGDELSFEILQNNEQFDSDSGFSDDQTYLYEWCVDPLLGCVDFFFDDSYGDGMECSWGSDDGYFTLSLNGNEVFSESGNWGFSSYYAFPCGAFGGDDYDYFYYYNPFIDMCEEEGDVGTYVYLELGMYRSARYFPLVFYFIACSPTHSLFHLILHRI